MRHPRPGDLVSEPFRGHRDPGWVGVLAGHVCRCLEGTNICARLHKVSWLSHAPPALIYAGFTCAHTTCTATHSFTSQHTKSQLTARRISGKLAACTCLARCCRCSAISSMPVLLNLTCRTVLFDYHCSSHVLLHAAASAAAASGGGGDCRLFVGIPAPQLKLPLQPGPHTPLQQPAGSALHSSSCISDGTGFAQVPNTAGAAAADLTQRHLHVTLRDSWSRCVMITL